MSPTPPHPNRPQHIPPLPPQRPAVAVPEAKALRDRLQAARSLGETIRKALPSSRETGRRKKDEGPLMLEQLRDLRAQVSSGSVMDYLGALPPSRETGRRKMDEGPLTLEQLQGLRV